MKSTSLAAGLRGIFIIAIVLLSCTKETEWKGNLFVKVVTESEPISQASVSLHNGCDTLQLPASLRKRIRANAEGKAYFDALPSGNYTVWARGYSQNKQRYVEGKSCFLIKARQRQNDCEVVVVTY